MQEKFFGANEEVKEVRTLIQTIQEHNDQCRELVGKDYALITVRRYESCKRYLAELIKLKYDKEDLPLSEINGELVRAFEFYLKTEKECQQNTVIRYMKCLKKITNLALANEWITKELFIGIKFHEKEVIREFLTMDELHNLQQGVFLDRITVVRDVFTLLRSLGWRSLMYSGYLPNISFKTTTAIIGFASLAKRRRICATSLARYSDADFGEIQKPSYLPKEKCIAPCPLQSEDEQLPERDSRFVWHIKVLDHAHSSGTRMRPLCASPMV